MAKKTIRSVDEIFDKQISSFTANDADKIVFNLGNPSRKVLSAGAMNKPLKLFGSKVLKKMKKHGYGIEELKGLPKAVRNPIAVFKNKSGSNYSILTTLKTNNGNFLVAIEQGRGIDANFNVVTSVFGKGKENVVDWINKGYLRYVDKKKALRYLYLEAPIATAANNKELLSAANIVRSFRNNNISAQSFIAG